MNENQVTQVELAAPTPQQPEQKESLLQSERFKLTMAGIALNVAIVLLAKYLEMDPAELIALVAGNSGLFGNMVVQRTKRNVPTSNIWL